MNLRPGMQQPIGDARPSRQIRQRQLQIMLKIHADQLCEGVFLATASTRANSHGPSPAHQCRDDWDVLAGRGGVIRDHANLRFSCIFNAPAS
jgi:hypothetical protein